MPDKLFGTDGIRGRANIFPILPETALQAGRALGCILRKSSDAPSPRVVIGKDTRLSGYMLETALTSGLVSMGCRVLLVGPMPTPAVAHLTKSMGCSAGVMLSASHNPYPDNGLKFFGNDGFKLNDSLEAEMEQLILSPNLADRAVDSSGIGKAFRLDDARGRYIEFAKNAVGTTNLDGVRVVVDCANGAAYDIGPLILEELGADVIRRGDTPDGVNINRLCGAMHPEAMGQAVRESGASIGVAFDGDADRVIFCDHLGKPVSGDRILYLCALALHEESKLFGDTLVTTVMSNLGLHASLKENGIGVATTPVGDRHVIERMREGGFSFGGENSGHVIFMDHATTGDGIMTALQVLKILQRKNATLQELAQGMREYPQKLTNLQITEKRPLDELADLEICRGKWEQAFGDDGRVFLRYSGTENLLRILVEAPDAAAVETATNELTAAAQAELL